MDENQIIMLGTGNAIVTKCYNTCFILKCDKTIAQHWKPGYWQIN